MFQLRRYYSIASFIGIVALIASLSFFINRLSMETLMAHQGRANANLTRSFANSIKDKFLGFVKKSEKFSSSADLQGRPEIARLQRIARKHMEGTSVVKVKIYNRKGLTVFSTDPGQIGKDKSKNPGFIKARSGRTASMITFRNEFYAFEKVIVDRNIIASYIPVRENGRVSAVFEVYSDVTPLVDLRRRTRWKVILGVVSLLALLYLFLFLIVRHADRVMAKQEETRKEHEAAIRHHAFHDTLTGLPNRLNFNESITGVINRARRHGKDAALLFIDLDRFKLINDSLGHDAGDHVLKITAERIRRSIREMDMAFRMSGDEFVVITEDLEKTEAAILTAERLLYAMEKSIELGEHEVIINMSIGITGISRERGEADINEIIKEADVAMFHAKKSGRNQYRFFSMEMDMAAGERLQLETDLQYALNNDEFLLYYQPKVDPETREVKSLEALLRWKHPTKGLLLPDEFIPLLEEIGMIVPAGEWVLKTACKQVRELIDKGLPPIRMAVNVSTRQFYDRGFVDTVKNALEEAGVEARHLELELTETMFLDDVEYAIERMAELKELGVSLSIDDFGSGYSSMNYLKKFPIDYLKIDRAFIKDIVKSEKDLAITDAIATLAGRLKLGLIAEGIESEEQIAILQKNRFQELQGFLFSRPVPGLEIESYIRSAALKTKV